MGAGEVVAVRAVSGWLASHSVGRSSAGPGVAGAMAAVALGMGPGSSLAVLVVGGWWACGGGVSDGGGGVSVMGWVGGWAGGGLVGVAARAMAAEVAAWAARSAS